ncbi:MAG: D-alanyl-D-alanine carboxypeptidase family protein [Leucobacter sp.]
MAHHATRATVSGSSLRAIALPLIGVLAAAALAIGAVALQSSASAARGAGFAPGANGELPVLDASESGIGNGGGIPVASEGGASDSDGRLTEADGLLPAGASVFDDAYPAIVNLRPELLAALRAAASDAQNARVEFTVNSGWRSARLQEQLLREAVAQYGSEEEAARWVATAETSAHVSGDAVDLDGADAAAWLAAHGSAYGLCQIYANEPWHVELRPDAPTDGCPAMYTDPTEDPRMQD